MTRRRVLNNIFVQLRGVPGLNFQPDPGDFVVDGNLHWGVTDGPGYKGDFFQKQGHVYAFRGRPYPDGWMAHDRFADPKFVRLDPDPAAPADLTLGDGSPATDAGVPLPEEWFDPLRREDPQAPDIGAFPRGLPPWRVGIAGRISVVPSAP